MFSNIVLVVHNYIMYMYMYLYKEPTAVPDTVSHEWHPGITVQCTYMCIMDMYAKYCKCAQGIHSSKY